MMKQWPQKCSAGRRRLAAAGVTVVLALTLAGCETLPGGAGGPSETRAMRLVDAGDYDAAAAMYMQLAGAREGAARDRYVLDAARAWIRDGDSERARMAISQVSEPAEATLRNEWLVAGAALANLRGDGRGALQRLDRVDTGRVSLDQRIDLEGVRGDAYFLADDPLRAIETLQRRELWLGSSDEIAANHARIWDGLLQSSPEALRAALAGSDDRVLSGWLALGTLADGSLAGGPASGLAGWQRQYPNHPALRFVVPGLTGDATMPDAGTPQQLALLLTVSGRNAPVGEAIRDGFLTHYARRFEGRIDAPTVRVYDVGEDGAILAYQQAVGDGADFVIGPVIRSSVDEIASFGRISVPTLALNYASESRFQPMLYQFGLAPEDEAAAAARRAIAEGHRRAVALAPASDWGDRVLQAFAVAFRDNGGELLDFQTYIASDTDYNDEIQDVMLLNDSVARYRSMRTLLGENLQFEPRRRQDVDFIFMAASADSARRLKPQLRFHYAGDLPVFATSAVNAASRQQSDSDLNGIRFSDIAWLVDGMRGTLTPLQAMADLLPSASVQPRLFALGFDAFDAVMQISAPTTDSLAERTWQGATGTLTLRTDGTIRRQTHWAVFDGGQPVALPPLADPMRPLTEDRALRAPGARSATSSIGPRSAPDDDG